MPHPPFPPGETDIFRVHPSIVILIARLLLVVIGVAGLLVLAVAAGLGSRIFLIPLFLGLVLAFIFILEWFRTVYLVTTKRIEYRYGIFGIDEEEISLADVQSVTFGQSFWGLLFNFGNLKISSAAKNEVIVFKGIGRPKERSNQIEDLSIA